MQNKKLIEDCQNILKYNPMSKSDFKKKYSYKYKMLSKLNLIDKVFLNYNEDFFKLKKLKEFMTKDDVIAFCKTKKKSEISSKIKRLLNIYNLDINKVDFKKREQQCKYSNEYLESKISKYIFEIELILNDYDVYQFCKNKKILKKFNLIKSNISLPQLICKYILDSLLKEQGELNNRKIIRPKEIDIFYKEHNLCVEYNGLYWHKNRINDDILKEKEILKKGYNFIKINENSKNYISDIKNQMIDNLNIINNASNLNISKDDIINIEIDMCKIFDLDINNIYEKLSCYDTKVEFVEKEKIIFQQMRKIGVENIINNYYKKIEINKLKNINSSEVLKNFKNITTLKNKNNKLYKYILSEKKEIIEDIKLYNLKYFNEIKKYNSIYDIKKDDRLYQIALKYKRKKIIQTNYYSLENIDFFVKNNSYFDLVRNKTFLRFLKEDGSLDYFIKKFKEKDFNKYFILKLSIDEIKKIALNYSSINSFSKDYPKVIKYIRNNNMTNVVFKHLSSLKFKNTIEKKEKYNIKMS